MIAKANPPRTEMSVQILGNNRFGWPNTTVVHIEASWDGRATIATGSGVIVGRNDVLTAAHVVHDPVFGFADHVKITISYDPFGSTGPSYYSQRIWGYTDYDPDGDTLIAPYTSGLGGAEIDFAVLGFNETIGNTHGMMWLEAVEWGNYYLSGYPSAYGNRLTSEINTAPKFSGQSSFDISNFDVSRGSSGGPLWAYDGSYGQVLGVVSTTGAAGAVAGIWSLLISELQDNDVLIGQGGKGKYIVSGSGNSKLYGSTYGDQINGDRGNDTIHGNGGHDILYGGTGTGNDVIYGGDGNDIIHGGEGNDKLTGQRGSDLMIGGAGKDIFDYNFFSETGGDIISDFRHLYDDLDFSTMDASRIFSGNNSFVWRGGSAFTSSSQGELRYRRFDNPGTTNDYTMLYGDNDSDTAAEFEIRIAGLVTVNTNDLIL